MNGKDIFLGLRYIGDDLVEKAEYGHFPAQTEKNAPKRPRLFRRPLLVAALILLALLLVGCAAVYVLNLNGLKLGEQQVTQDVYDYDPNSGEAHHYVGQQTLTQQVLTLAGVNDSPASQAAREWYSFLETYDPDRSIQASLWGNEPVFPEEYRGYGLYSQEMKDKLDEILAKYDLELRGAAVEFPSSRQLFRALGIDSVLNPGTEATARLDYTSYHENGNLDVWLRIDLPTSGSADTISTQCYLYYRPKDCFIPDTAVLTEADWQEWNYTTASGENVLLLYSQETSSAWIFCDRANYTVSVRVDTIRSLSQTQSEGQPVAEFTVMTRQELEQIADAVNFSLEPKLTDGWQDLPDDSVPAGQSINGYTIQPVSAFTDGYAYRIVLRITAPAWVDLTDPDDFNLRVESSAGALGQTVEDGDGDRSTCNVIVQYYANDYDLPEDGSPLYSEDTTIPIYWEDLYVSTYDRAQQKTVYTLLTEGTWSFEVPLSTVDTREVELLTQPITVKACTGWKADGTDILEDVELTSLKLRALSLDVSLTDSSADIFLFNRQWSRIVMLDGTCVEFASADSLDRPIDLDQVAYVQLAGGTILPMPGVEEETLRLLSEKVQEALDAAYVPAPVFEDGVELLTQPITMQHLAGYVTDPTGSRESLYEYLTISSVILHPNGLALFGPAAFDDPTCQATVVLRNGTRITLTGMGGTPYCDEPLSQLASDTPIDLTQVDHVILPDGTTLSMPTT